MANAEQSGANKLPIPIEFIVIFPLDEGERRVDLTSIGPLTLGDKKRLFHDHKVDLNNLEQLRNLPPEKENAVALFICHKVDKGITSDMIDVLPITVVSKIVMHQIVRSQEVAERPFLKLSHSSESPAAGAKKN